MSYALRNTLVLLAVLLLFAGGAWGYITFYQGPKIEDLQTKLAEKQDDLEKKENIAERYDQLYQTYQEAKEYYQNYQKALYPSNNEDQVFDFLTSVNHGAAYNNFNFVFVDSVNYKKYGILTMQINGTGYYRNVVNFVRAIELSEPLNKVRNLNINPIKQDSSYHFVQYSFDLKSYYDRTKILENRALEIDYRVYASLHNPFYPLVHDIKPNTENKINISKSKLIALSARSVFLIDQNGIMRQVHLGDEVYLGYLSDINLQHRTATFILNKGGLIERVTIGKEYKKDG